MHFSQTPLWLACLAGIASAQYHIQDTYDKSNFFNQFNFFNGPDPTHGFVNYVSEQTANNTALAGYSGNAVYLGVDHTTPNPSGGRASVRVSSNKAYTHGLFVADIQHMPNNDCGVWPAFWTFGPNWPASGEIDIIEGVNTQTTNQVTLHTSAQCSLSNAGAAGGSVSYSNDCNSNNAYNGCGQGNGNTQSFGGGFNAVGGGVYAMEWTSSSISVWFFPRSSIPGDVKSGNPNPSSWGAPQARFSGSGCNIDSHFMNHNIVFDTTFCGDWAGSVWSSNPTCSQKAASCQDYVAGNPGDFADAYWLINSVKVYSQSGQKARRDGLVPKPFLA